MIISSLILVKCRDQILLCKRSLDQKGLPGYWSGPGGVVETRRSVYLNDCEFREETNLVLKSSKKIDIIQTNTLVKQRKKLRFSVRN